MAGLGRADPPRRRGARLLARGRDRRHDAERYRPGASEVMALRVGHEKLTAETGWMPKVSWEEGVLQTIRWYAENRESWIGRVDWLPRAPGARRGDVTRACWSPAAAASSAHTSSSGSTRDGHDVVVPRGARLRPDAHGTTTARLFDDARPELVFHLAAEVGGIGANRANPGRYWYANLMMGAHVLEQARLHGDAQARDRRERSAPTRSSRRSRSARTTSGTATRRRRTRPTASRRRRSSSARRRTASSTGLNAIFLLPVEPLRPARQLRPRDVARDPGADPQDGRSRERGDGDRALGRRLADPRVPLRRRLRRGARARRRALRRRPSRSTSAPARRSRSATSPSSIAELTGFDGRDRVGHDEAERPAAPQLDTTRAEELFGFARAVAAPRGPRAHGRLVPRRSTPSHDASLTRRLGRVARRAAVATAAEAGRRRSLANTRAALATLADRGRSSPPSRSPSPPATTAGSTTRAATQTLFSTTAWSLGARLRPDARVGYGWSLRLAPITGSPGPSSSQALPGIVVVQTCSCCPSRLALRLRDRGARRRPPARPLVGGAWVVAPYRRDPALRRRLPREVRRSVPAAGARADRDGRLLLHGRAARRCACFAAPRDRRALVDATRRSPASWPASRSASKPPNGLFLVGAARRYLAARRDRAQALAFGVGARAGADHARRVEAARPRRPAALRSATARRRRGRRRLPSGRRCDRYVNLDLAPPGRRTCEPARVLLERPARRSGRRSPGGRRRASAPRRRRCSSAGWRHSSSSRDRRPWRASSRNAFFRRDARLAGYLLLALCSLLVPDAHTHLGERLSPAPPGRRIGGGPWRPSSSSGRSCRSCVVTVSRPAQSPQDVVLVGEERSAQPAHTAVDPSIHVTAARTRRAVCCSRWSSRTWRAGTLLSRPANTGSGRMRRAPAAGVTSCLLDMEAIAETRRRDISTARHRPERRTGSASRPTTATRPAGGDMFVVSPPVQLG